MKRSGWKKSFKKFPPSPWFASAVPFFYHEAEERSEAA
jgi:hypothetical protein